MNRQRFGHTQTLSPKPVGLPPPEGLDGTTLKIDKTEVLKAKALRTPPTPEDVGIRAGDLL